MFKTLRIGLQIDSVDPFWVEVREAIWHRDGHDSMELIPLDVYALGVAARDQMDVVEDILVQDLDALITSDLTVPVIRCLLDQQLPVISLSEVTLTHPRFTAPTGLYDIARRAGDYIIDRLQGRGHVVIVGGMVVGHNDDGQSRIAGMTAVLEQAPGMDFEHISTPWGYHEALDYIRAAMMGVKPAYDALFGLSDTLALAARDVGRTLGLVRESTLVVGVNGDPLALAAIAKAEMTATMAMPATDLGCRAVELACRAARGQELPASFERNAYLVTGENVAEVAVGKLIAIADLPSRLVGSNRLQEQKRSLQQETSLTISRLVGSFGSGSWRPHLIAELIRSNFGYDHVHLFRWDGERRSFVLESRDGATVDGAPIPLDQSALLGRALISDRPVFIPDTQRTQRYASETHPFEMRSRLILPIRLGDKPLGALDLQSRQPSRHTHRDLEGLQSLADQLGVAIHNERLYQAAVVAHDEAEQANQAKTRLLARVSHELRTPLNVILGYSQAALAEPNPYDVPLPAELTQDLEHIQRSGQHLARLINDLLDHSLAEIDRLHLLPEPIAMHPFLTELFQGLAGSAGGQRSVDWRLQLPVRLPTMEADPVRLRQILLRLLENAGNYTKQGHITLGAEEAPPYLHIWVEDTGDGIPEALHGRIFRPFMAAENVAMAGDGVGLSVAWRLVQLHRGHIQVTSRPGLGSTFHVYLPLSAGLEGVPHLTPAQDGSHHPDPAATAHGPAEIGAASTHGVRNPLVRQILAFLHDNYDQPVARQAMADRLGISKSYLTRIFRQELGLTPWEYLIRFRIDRARILLAESGASITEIACQVGFRDHAYFSRTFRRETGKSPQSYRKQAN